MQGLSGKVVLIAGGATGLGEATARRLTGEGCQVAVGDINIDKARSLAEELGTETAIAVRYDAADISSIEAMIEAVIVRYGRIDILLNSAALTTPEVMDTDLSVTDISFDTWNAVFNVNVTGYLSACKFAVPHMIAGGGGSIINIASGSGLVGDIVRTAYGVSKAAVISLTQHVATQYGRQGIRCNAIAPGIILTAATEFAVPELVAIIRRHVLLPRLGVADDIASLVTFLASDESANITGQTICCDGGSMVHQPQYADVLELAAR